MTLEMIAAFIIGSIAIGRATRLIVDDDMPLITPARDWLILKLPAKWAEGLTCAFCVSVWFAALNTAWAYISDLHWTWWFLNLLLASAYVGAIINGRDIPSD